MSSLQALLLQPAGQLGLHRAATSPAARFDSCTTMSCRTNLKKEKRQRNQENMRKFKKGAPPTARGGGGKKKTMSRKKLTLKAQAAVEKGREATFMSKLFLATGGALEEKLDLGVL